MRQARHAPGGLAYHVINRGNGRMRIFWRDGDYVAFLKAMREAQQAVPMRILAYCLMPNHWHLVLWPHADGELSRFVGWMTNTHVRRYHCFHDTEGTGHIYQGRFKSFAIEQDIHLLRVLRYVEANPVRGKLVERAQAWPWSSLGARSWGGADMLHEWPVARPANWDELVNEPLEVTEVGRIRTCVNRARPYGSASWIQSAGTQFGLRYVLRDRGRPRKIQVALI